ncbi:MAG: DUF3568 domain-containing protein [Desulfobacula sp.]|nr:DUF3568 domain-containing protein [Desulfobacula sp.]
MKNRLLSPVLFWGLVSICTIFIFNGCMMAPAILNLKNPEKIFRAPIGEVYLAATLTLDNFGLKFTEETQKQFEKTLNAELSGGRELTIRLRSLGENLTKVSASTGYFNDDEATIQELFHSMDQKIKRF